MDQSKHANDGVHLFMTRPNLLASAVVIVAASSIAACHHSPPAIKFAPTGTDTSRLRSEYSLTDAERVALTPQSVRQLTQEQLDQIYKRLSSGPIPDGPFRGDLFFPRDSNRHAPLSDLVERVPPSLAHLAALPIERLGLALWKGKVFFRSQSLLRNRIDDLAVLKPIFPDTASIPKLTFDGETTWLLFPARVSCGQSRLDPTRPSIVIDYAKGSEIEGYRPIPDKLAGPEGLNILDEIRGVRRGFYIGRAYFGARFALNFTLLDPTVSADTMPSQDILQDCASTPSARF
jgi:hypothetical protein